MDHPKTQIAHIMHTLCSGSPSAQKETLETYFTPDASFSHPLCSVPSFSSVTIPGLGEVNSRWVLSCIYRWYKVLSPRVKVGVDGIEYNSETQSLFVQLHQDFHLFFLPLFATTANLTTIISLTPSPASSPSSDAAGSSEGRRRIRYLIKHQEDLYQSTEIVKFFWPGGTQIVGFGRLVATLLCIVGAMAFAPITWMEQWGWFGNGKDVKEKGRGDEVDGEENGDEVNGVIRSKREKKRTNHGVGRKDR
ncbi:hypothetical protein DSL72_003755 [Monilinia vaccinii-corymbosi]|uniref:SigF-like NTF2-like domain-containing protein n=1 Tax=Monilinia vaccinii-corymbosi TaxID=61207 RepID=A0A8A3NUV6_9HELO|nr:hypothetical protein DSL72_003755 [Monilinia vaccinii-corymbosi]